MGQDRELINQRWGIQYHCCIVDPVMLHVWGQLFNIVANIHHFIWPSGSGFMWSVWQSNSYSHGNNHCGTVLVYVVYQGRESLREHYYTDLYMGVSVWAFINAQLHNNMDLFCNCLDILGHRSINVHQPFPSPFLSKGVNIWDTVGDACGIRVSQHNHHWAMVMWNTLILSVTARISCIINSSYHLWTN